MFGGNVILSFSCLCLSMSLTSATDRLPSFLRKGQCSPALRPMSTFELERFTGRWYKIGGFKNPEQETAVNCTTWDVTQTATGFDLLTHGIDEQGRQANAAGIVSDFNAVATKGVAAFSHKTKSRELPLFVVSTDYSSYACVVSCLDVVQTHYVMFAWILNREPNFNRKVISNCQLSFKKARISVSKLRGTPQGAQCVYPN